MGTFLSEETTVTVAAPVADGTDTITSDPIDMAGFSGALVICRLGTPATDNNLRLSQCETADGEFAELAGSLVGDHASDSPLVADLKAPSKRYLKYTVTRGTSTTIDALTIIQYGPRSRPTTQPAGTQIERHHAPVEGAA
jgi:hypothetical protein